MGTALSRHQAETNIAEKAEGYAMKSETVHGWTSWLLKMLPMWVESVGQKIDVPARCLNLSLSPHSMHDPYLYRKRKK